MKNQNEKSQFEIQANEYIKKITDLEFENSLVTQKNKLLEKQLESLTNKYNELKKELLDIEEHINFCKDNQIEILNFAQNEKSNIKEVDPQNFNAFKNKIKILFEYDNNFLNTDSEVAVFNMIIDNITNLKNDNLNLRKTLEDLKSIMDNNINKDIKNNMNINLNNINNNNSFSNNLRSITPLNVNYGQNLNYSKNIGMGSGTYTTEENQNILRNKNHGFTYDISTTNDFENNNINNINNNNYDRYDIDKRCLNSKMHLNNLMNNIDNLQNIFNAENDFDLPMSSKNYSYSLNKPRLYHKYI